MIIKPNKISFEGQLSGFCHIMLMTKQAHYPPISDHFVLDIFRCYCTFHAGLEKYI